MFLNPAPDSPMVFQVAMLSSFATVLDSGWFRVAAYGVAAALAAYWYRHERTAPPSPARWPTYWLLTTVLLIVMGVARASAIGDLVFELGREPARSSGRYEIRRTLQAGAVVVIAGLWMTGVVVAVWRVPPLRRRYLPSVLIVSTLVMFGAIRLVSLHQIDTVLYRRDIGGVRIVAVAELTLLALTSLIMILVGRLQWGAQLHDDGSG
jgi:hypothetical protein